MNEAARVVAVLAAALIIAGCMPTLGFLSTEAVGLALLGTVLVAVALWAPQVCERVLERPWALRLLRVVGPAGLVLAAYRDALGPQPQPLGPYLGLLGFAALVVGLLTKRTEETSLSALLPGLVLWCAGAGLLYTRLMYVENTVGITAVSLGWILAVVIAAGMMFLPRAGNRATSLALITVLLVLGGAVRGGAIVASPRPVIDVYSVLDQTPKALLRGENPYAYRVISPYGTERARRFRVSGKEPEANLEFYTPGIILLQTPLAAAWLDPRWLMTGAWLLAGLLVFRQASRQEKLRANAPHLAAVLLLLPSASFTAEQAWVDAVFGLLFGVGMLPIAPILAGVVLGWAVTVKQTALALIPAIVAGWHRSRAALAACAVTVLAITLPFLFWDPGEFLHDCFLGYAALPIFANAVSLPAWLLRATNWRAPGLPLTALALMLGVLAAWRGRGSSARLLLAGGFSLLALNLLAKWAYLNYYEVAALLLVFAAGFPDRPPGPCGAPDAGSE